MEYNPDQFKETNSYSIDESTFINPSIELSSDEKTVFILNDSNKICMPDELIPFYSQNKWRYLYLLVKLMGRLLLML